MTAAIPAAPANLLKALAEDPITYEKEMGCMTGILQIFDRHHSFTGRRCGSKRVNSSVNGAALPELGQTHSNLSTDYMFEGHEPELLNNANRQTPLVAIAKSPKWASRKNGGVLTHAAPVSPHENSFYKPTEEPTTPSLSFYFRDQQPRTPEHPTKQKGASKTSYGAQKEALKHSAAQPGGFLDRNASSKNSRKSAASDIRDIVRESFHKEKPRMSVDTANKEMISGLTHLKNLPRSISVNARYGYCRSPLQFPRSTSVDAQISSRMYSDGNETTCIAELPRFQSREINVRNLTNPRRSFDNNDSVPRLTVELEEGPRLGSSNSDRRRSLDNPEKQIRPTGLDDPSRYERQATTLVGFDFRESLRAVDFKESQNGREAHRFSVDGMRDVPRPSSAPRLSVDGRDTSQREQQPSPRDEYESTKRRGTNVVARLMGLDELPCPSAEKESKCTNSKSSAREENLIHGGIPAGSQCRTRIENSSLIEKGSQGNGDGQRRARSVSPNHHLMDGMPPLFRQQEAREALKCRIAKSKKHFCDDEPLQSCSNPSSSPSHEPLHGDMLQRLQQLRSRNSAHERKTLNQILEAIQLKGLLHPPHRKDIIQTANPPVENKFPILVDTISQHEQTKEAPNASPNLLLRGLEHMDLEHQATPKFGGQGTANIESRRKQISPEDSNSHKIEQDASIVVMRPIQTKVNRALLSKDLDSLSSKSGSSDRSFMAASTRVSSDNGVGRRSVSPSRVQTKGSNDTRITRPNSSQIPLATLKGHSSPGREPLSPRPHPPIKAPFGSTSIARISPSKTPRARASFLKFREESKAVLVTLRNRSSIDGSKESVKNLSSPGVTNAQSTKSHYAKTSIEVVKSKRFGKVSDKDTKIFERDAPGNGADRRMDSNRSGIASTSLRGTSPGRRSGRITTCTDLDTPKPCVDNVTPAINGTQTSCFETKVLEAENQVRLNASEAVDQSGNNEFPEPFIHRNAVESSSINTRARLQVLNDQFSPSKENMPQKAVEFTKDVGEVTTPRGVSLKKSQVHENGQPVEGSEQPSPVSVLDNTLFEEDYTPSPKSGSTTPINLQDAFEALESIRQSDELKTQEHCKLAESSLMTGEMNPLFESSFRKNGTQQRNQSLNRSLEMQLPHDTKAMCGHMGTSIANRDEEREFVRDMLVVSGVTKDHWIDESSSLTRGHIMNPLWLAKYEKRCRREDRKALANVEDAFLNGWCKTKQEKEKELLDRRALFDCLNELLAQKLILHANPQPWVEAIPLRAVQNSKGQRLVQEIWEELQEIPSATSEDVCDTVQSILQKDLGPRGLKWANFGTEIGEVGIEVEKLIYKDLVDEVVKELTPLSCRKSLKLSAGSPGPRRQLFTI